MNDYLLKQENGYDWQILNRVAVPRELMDILTIMGTDKILSDARLVAAAGSNLAQASEKLGARRPVMDSETNRLRVVLLPPVRVCQVRAATALDAGQGVRGRRQVDHDHQSAHGQASPQRRSCA